MAKIENRALRDLVKSETQLKQVIEAAAADAKAAEVDYNAFINQKYLAEKELKEVQDAIALLEKKDASKNKKAK